MLYRQIPLRILKGATAVATGRGSLLRHAREADMRRPSTILAAALLASSCSVSEGVPQPGSSPSTAEAPATSAAEQPASPAAPTTTAPSTTTTEPDPCPSPLAPPPQAAAGGIPVATRLDAADPIAAAVAISQQAFLCSDIAVVARPDDPEAVIAAADVAAASGGPLLLGSPGGSPVLDAELDRLAPERVIRVGFGVRLEAPEDALVETISTADVTVEVLPRLLTAATGGEPGPEPPTTTTTTGTTSTTGAEPTTTTAGESAEAAQGGEGATTEDPGSDAAPGAIIGAAAGEGSSGMLWLVDHRDVALAATAAAAALTTGGLMVVVDGTDLRAGREVVQNARAAGAPAAVTLVGRITDDADWQLPILLGAPELPGGGLLLFPGRRLLAFYGSPLTPVLGVLGEQGPEATAERLATVLPPYGADGLEVLPAFEMIATVADSREGSDGNYSNELDLELLRPWIEAAADGGIYVLLDLQPGRTDFLTQAQRYEEFLRLPHVGLALDPEWRLGPDEFHLRQFGSVQPDEVNRVVAWLAELVRTEGLPQKLLLLHQFRLSMLPDRELIEKPAELAVVIQMDGQGPLASKYETWAAITAGTEGEGWWWGWKNFYDEDLPTPTPEQVLDLEPTVVYVSYQ
jgi:hypothetical protein